MSLNLHLYSGKDDDIESPYILFQTPTHVSVRCRGKTSAEIVEIYAAWLREEDLGGEEHIQHLKLWISYRPNHVWEVW